jgi:predicted alpha/beta hydrolase
MRRTIEKISTKDRWQLTADLITPENPRGVVIAGHAMMVNRKTLDRPKEAGLATHLARAGFAVLVPDLRGHGDSGPRASEGGQWSYDDITEQDTPALIDLARQRFPGKKLCLLGHSLFGHASAAYAASAAAPPEALVLLASNIWLPRFEPSNVRWLLKRATLETLLLISRKLGYCPAKKVGFGSEDEALAYFEQFLVWARGGRWVSTTGDDYLLRLPRFKGHTLAVVGAADTINCRPECAHRFAQNLGGTLDFRVVGRRSGLSFDPGHMELVTDQRSEPLWREIAEWLQEKFSV